MMFFSHFPKIVRTISSVRQYSKKDYTWLKKLYDSEMRRKDVEMLLMQEKSKLRVLQTELLKLKNNFNLRGALEFSLDEYKQLQKLPEDYGKTKVLDILIKDQEYKNCLKKTLERYQLRRVDVNSSARIIYHELLKYAHTRYGNKTKLVVDDTEHTITEVAAIESVFCALKKRRCFQLPLTIQVDKEERILD